MVLTKQASSRAAETHSVSLDGKGRRFSINSVAGGWKWIFVLVADFPFSLLIGHFASPDSLAAFAIFGTLWWYSISVFLRWIFGVGESIANR